ncbi:MAG: hypothetical protein EXR79_04715 [Myxococcales bacterium]|nr:hypothetical protein [Myxococcales bacterium]
MSARSFRKSVLASAVAAVIALGLTPVAFAVPTTLGLQGSLVSAGGGPVPDGPYVMSFGLFAEPTGGKALWSEGPLVVTVKGGVWTLTLGAKSPLDPKIYAGKGAAWIEVKIEPDAELSRVALHTTPFAARAAWADGVDCSGCISAAHLHPDVLKDVALKSQLSTVALSGAFKDLSGGPDLSAYAQAGDLAPVAITGHYKDLSGQPPLAKVGAACGSGLVLKGFKEDGSHECVVAMDPKALPADGLDEISNGLLTNQFTEVAASKTAPFDILDNVPKGTSDIIDVPDFGIAQNLTVSVDLENSDISTIQVFVLDPNGVAYLLYDKGAKGVAVKTTYPDPTATVSGNLTTWIGKNPKGKWTLQVIDSGFKDNKNDGKVNGWSVNVSTLSTKKVASNGVLQAKGGMQYPLFEAAPWPCSAATLGYTYVGTKDFTLNICNGKEYFVLSIKQFGTSDNPGWSCKDILTKQPASKDGIYWMQAGGGAFQTWCDMTTNGGGWTLAARMKGGSWCHIDVAKVGALTATNQAACAKLSDVQIKALYSDQFWLSCGANTPNRFGKIDSINNFDTVAKTGGQKMTWSQTYGGAAYSGTSQTCCNLGDHDYHNPHIIYSIATGHNGGNYTADWSGCYNSLHGWSQDGYLMVR